MVRWCREKNLVLNVDQIKQMLNDFQRHNLRTNSYIAHRDLSNIMSCNNCHFNICIMQPLRDVRTLYCLCTVCCLHYGCAYSKMTIKSNLIWITKGTGCDTGHAARPLEVNSFDCVCALYTLHEGLQCHSLSSWTLSNYNPPVKDMKTTHYTHTHKSL